MAAGKFFNLQFVEQIHDIPLEENCPFHAAAAVLRPDFAGRRRVVSGRGTSREEARATCLAEAVERWSSIYSAERKLTSGSRAEIGPAAVAPHSLILMSDSQYGSVAAWNRTVSADHRLPARRSIDERIAWVEAYSFASDSSAFIPAAYCLLGYPSARQEGFPIPDSSGLAAGDDLESCIARGLLELIERDAVSIWWYGRVARPEARLDRGKLPVLEAFKKWVERSGRRLWLLDLTHDLQVPVIAAITCDMSGCNLSFGFAASWTLEEAAYSALGELVQFEATKRLMASSFDTKANAFVRRCTSASIYDWSFVRATADTAPASVASFAIRGPASWAKLLEQKGLELIVLDLSPQQLPLAVARVIVPGLRHLWPRFAPGRLFDVPFQLGWHSRMLQEDQLNPIPILY